MQESILTVRSLGSSSAGGVAYPVTAQYTFTINLGI